MLFIGGQKSNVRVSVAPEAQVLRLGFVLSTKGAGMLKPRATPWEIARPEACLSPNGISLEEAVKRINRLWLGTSCIGDEDLIYHQSETSWITHIYEFYEERIRDGTANLSRDVIIDRKQQVVKRMQSWRAMNPIDQLFSRLKADRRKAFIPFITAGDPNRDATGLLLREAARRGASLIEVGFPYSDPIADGSVIQASYTRALQNGLRIDDIFTMIRQLTQSADWKQTGVPLVGMVSYSLVHHRGPERFIQDAQAAGFSGAIVPDLPVDEADELAKLTAKHDFKLILLVTPTTPRERAIKIAQLSTGFLYCVSVVGITGERSQLPPDLLDQLRWLRTQTPLPLCVGFGVSKPEHVRNLREAADGVIVGSALVRKLEQQRPVAEIVREVGDLIEELANALHD